MARSGIVRTELPPALRALADPTRLKIMLLLDNGPRTVGEIVDAFDFTQPTITRHLQTLAAAGLVSRRKERQCVYYAANRDNLRDVCVKLAGCFPCCCVAVEAAEPAGRIRENSSSGGPSGARRNPKTRTKKKGGAQ